MYSIVFVYFFLIVALPLCIIYKFKQISTEISHGISDSRLSPGSPGGHRILFHGCIQAPRQAGNVTQRFASKILIKHSEFAFPSPASFFRVKRRCTHLDWPTFDSFPSYGRQEELCMSPEVKIRRDFLLSQQYRSSGRSVGRAHQAWSSRKIRHAL